MSQDNPYDLPAASDFGLDEPLLLRQIPPGGLSYTGRAPENWRQQMAQRLGLEEMPSLVADIELAWSGHRDLQLVVNVAADVVQLCVVTLEPVATTVREHFVLRYRIEPAAHREGGSGQSAPSSVAFEDTYEGNGDVDIDVMAEDPPEVITGNAVDVGEMVIQHLSLALDPYPRHPNADLSVVLDAVNDAHGTKSGLESADEVDNRDAEGYHRRRPFADLARLLK